MQISEDATKRPRRDESINGIKLQKIKLYGFFVCVWIDPILFFPSESRFLQQLYLYCQRIQINKSEIFNRFQISFVLVRIFFYVIIRRVNQKTT